MNPSTYEHTSTADQCTPSITLAASHAVIMAAGQSMELRGLICCPVGTKLENILASPNCSENIQVNNVEVIRGPAGQPPAVRLKMCNISKLSVKISPKDVLAKLYMLPGEHGEPDTELENTQLGGLVGPACESNAMMNGVPCKCLLDSGSQVTTIAKSFYETHLASSTPLQEISCSELKVEGAGGQHIPYEGFVRVRMKFSKEAVGTNSEVETLALICPDTTYTRDTPVIVGTNTFVALSKECKEKYGPNFTKSLQVRPEVRYAYQDALEGYESGRVGTVRVLGKQGS